MIVRLLPNVQRYVVARLYSRSEAENHQRFLNRFMPAAEFEVVFDAPSAVATDRYNEIHYLLTSKKGTIIPVPLR